MYLRVFINNNKKNHGFYRKEADSKFEYFYEGFTKVRLAIWLGKENFCRNIYIFWESISYHVSRAADPLPRNSLRTRFLLVKESSFFTSHLTPPSCIESPPWNIRIQSTYSQAFHVAGSMLTTNVDVWIAALMSFGGIATEPHVSTMRISSSCTRNSRLSVIVCESAPPSPRMELLHYLKADPWRNKLSSFFILLHSRKTRGCLYWGFLSPHPLLETAFVAWFAA